jgi:hemerythrin superfamily protein
MHAGGAVAREYVQKMDAIELLKAQHRLVEKFFEDIEQGDDPDERESTFLKLADNFAAHATIEEQIFYPRAYGDETEELLLDAVEEHLSIKRLVTDLLDMEPDDDQYAAKIKVLKEQIGHHVKEEEGDLFKKVEKQFDKQQLEELGQEMLALFEREMSDDPSSKLPEQTDEAASLR